MHLPPLRSANHPHFPQWAKPLLTKSDLNSFCRRLAMIIGVNHAQRILEPLGNGFVVMASGHLQILSASHLFSDFANRLWERPRHAPVGTDAVADLVERQRRIRRLLEEGLVKVFLQCGDSPRAPTVLQDISGLSCGTDIFECNVALLQCALPAGFDAQQFPILLIDREDFDFTEPVALAGFVVDKDLWKIPFGQEEKLRMLRSQSCIRVGYVADTEPGTNTSAGLLRSYRVNIPTLPGMSGGPMVRIRPPLGVDVTAAAGTRPVWTAAGVISYALQGEASTDHCADGETRVYAMGDVGLLSGEFAEGMVTVEEEIRRGWMPTYEGLQAHVRALRNPIASAPGAVVK
jgi:hypothetical protein